MGGLNSGPGPGITLLIAIVLVLAQTASSAPLYEEDEGQESNSQGLAESHGCYYNFQHYNEGERILTNEPCLNCTCRNRMLMCYLRVCPFTKGIGQNCTVEKVPGQCCPIITCPEVPVQLLTSTTTEGIKAPGSHHGTKDTEVGHLDTNGCNIDGIFYPNGAQVPGSPGKPCELCYCIRNKTACIMQECALHVDGCRPVYEEGQCFPVRYQCDDSPYEEQPTTTIRPAPTPGLIITTTSAEPLDCTYNNEVYEDGSRIQTEDPCEHCYCLKGKIACAVQECGAPLEKEGQNCTALPPAPGKCCPDSYQCDVTMTSQGLNYGSEGTTETGIPSVADAGHPKDGDHPDQGIKATEKPSHSTNPLDHSMKIVTPSKGVGEQMPTKTKPQELDQGTQNELTESHLQGLHPMKPTSTSDGNQKITFPVKNNEDTKRPGIAITPEVSRPETTHIKENESYDHTTDDRITDMSNEEKRPHSESVSHVLSSSTKVPETTKPVDHSEGIIVEHSDPFGIQPTHSHGQTPYNPTTNNALNLKPQTSSSDTKDPLLDKLHNIIQDVQAQVSDGKTTEMPEQVDYQTTMQSQTGHFTEKPDILAHLPQLGPQTSSSGLVEMGSTANGTSPDDSNDIINKLQGIIQGIYSHVTESVLSTKTPESSTMGSETQSNIPFDNSGIIRPEGASEVESTISEKEDLKPHKGSEYSEKPPEIHRPYDTETTGESEVKDKYPSKQTTEKSQPEIYGTDHPVTVGFVDEIQNTHYPLVSARPQDSKYSTKTPSVSHSTEYPGGSSIMISSEDSSSKHPEKPVGYAPEGSIKLPLRPKPGDSDDEPYGAKHPETTSDGEEVLSTEYPYVTDKPNLSKYPQETNNYSEKIKPEGVAEYPGDSGTTKRPFNKENYPEGQKPNQELPEVTSSLHNQTYPEGFPSSEKHPEFHPDGSRPTMQYPEEFKPSSQYPEAVETTEQNSEEISSSGSYFEKFKPGQQYSEENSPTTQYPGKIKPLGQYPDKTKPAGFADTIFGTEYPESVTGKPDSETKYPASISLSEQYPGEFTSGQSNKIKPTEIYSAEIKPTGKYPESIKPSGQYFEKINRTQPEKFKPGQQYYDGSRPTEQHPEEYKPTGQYPERLKPSQHATDLKPGQYLEGSKPTGFYPEIEKPQSPTNASFQINYPEDVTGKPDNQSKYPENIGFVPSGQYPETTSQFPIGSKQPAGTKPIESDGIPFEYSEGVTDIPSDNKKYPQSSKYPDKTGQEDSETSSSASPFDTISTESSAVTSKPGNLSKYPEGFQPTDEYLVPEKPTGSKPYGTEHPEESGITDLPEGFTKNPEILKPGRPGTTDWPEYSTKYSQKNKPEHDHEDTRFTKPFETSTKPSGSEKFKPDDQSKYPEGYRPGPKPSSGSYPEGSKYPEIIGITDRPEDQTNPTTRYPEGLKPDEYPEGSKDPLNKSKPHSSTEISTSEDKSTKNPNETGVPSRPKPEYDMKPSGVEYSGITDRPDIFNGSGGTDLLVTFSKYPEKTKPEETPYEAEHQEEVTGKPDDGSKYSENVKPVGEYPDDSKYPITERPENSKKPYGSEHPEASGVADKPEKGSKYPERFKPTDENSKRPKPGAEDESEPLETTGKPEFSYESSTHKYSDKSPSTQKIDFAGHSDGLRPTQQYPEDSKTSRPQEQSKYPQKPEVENKPYDSESPDSTGRPDEQFTEHPNYSLVTAKPDDDDHQGFEHPEKEIKRPAGENSYPDKQKPKDKLSAEEYQTDVTDKPDGIYEYIEKEYTTGRPQGGTKYSQKPGTEISNVTDQSHEGYKPTISQRPAEPGEQPQNKPESGNELYDTEYTERPTASGILTLEDKLHGTEYPEGVTDKPMESGKYPNKNKEPGKRPQKPESEYSHESSTGRPDEENSKQNVTTEPQITAKYPEEAYVAQHPEKTKPPSADQLLETDTKPESLEKYPEKTKPNSGVDSVMHPSHSNKSGISGYSQQPGKPTETNESLEEITKGPHYTAQYPQKSSDRPPSSEYSEEMSKPQFPQEFEHTEKIKPMKYPGKPEPEDVPYVTEYPEKGSPDEAVHTVHTEEMVTDRPQNLNKHPIKSKPGSSDKSEDQIKDSTTPDFEEEPFGASATNKPEDKPKHPHKEKPGTEHLEVSGTDRPFDIEVLGEVGKPEYPGQEPQKYAPTGTEKLGMTYPPHEGSKKPQMSGAETFGTEYSNSETGTGRPEDSSSKPIGQKYPETIHYPELPGKPEYQSKYPEGFIQAGQSTERPHGSQYGTEYPDNTVTGRPEDHTQFPEGNEVEHYPRLTEKPQYSTKYSEGEKLHDSELSYGTESPFGALEYHTKHPDKFMPMGIHSQANNKPQQSIKYPGSSTQYPEETTDRTDDYAKYSESVTGLQGDHTKYAEGHKPTEAFSGATENLQGFTIHPESDYSFNTKYPELGLTDTSEDLTKRPADLRPGGFYPGQQVSGENSDLSTEYLNIGETLRPDINTRYPEEDKAHITEYPINFGITHEQSPTEQPEGSKVTDSLYGAEHTNLSGMTNEYTQKFKPVYGRPHPESLTEHPVEGKPTEIYSHGSELPEQEEPFGHSVTVGPDGVTRYPDNLKPVGSETTVHETEYPERITEKPENIKHSGGLKQPVETGTEYPEANTGEPVKESKYPEEFRPTAEYPHGSVQYSSKPKPELENKPYGTEYPKDHFGFTRYPYESSTTKHAQNSEVVQTTVFGQPDDLSKYPHGFKPGLENYPENLGVNGKPQGLTNFPQKKPLLEDESSGIQYPDETGKPESSTRFPGDKKPEGVESSGTVITDIPQKSKYPEESKYSEITTPDVKYTQKPKPTGSYDIPYGTAYPETTDSEDDKGTTKVPEHFGQHPSTQYPQRPKPAGFGEKPHGTENTNDVTDQPEGTSLYPAIGEPTVKYPLSSKPVSEDASLGEEHTEGISFTEKPDDESKYPDKTGYLTSRPFLGRPKPTGSDQASVTEDPNTAGKTSSSTYPEKSQSGFADDLHGNVHSETTSVSVSEDELHGTQYPDGSDKHSQGFRPTDKPYGSEYPEANKPGAPGKPYTSTKYPETVVEQKVTKRPGETEETDTPEKSPAQDFKKPQETVGLDVSGTEKYPHEFTPTSEYPKPSERPHVPSKYPIRPKPSSSDGDPHGAGHSEIIKKPENELSGTEYPKGTESTTRPEDEKYLESSKVTGKPHGIHRYPLRPKPIGLEDEPFGTEYPETTEEFDETLTAQGQDAFGKNTLRPKPATESEEIYVTAKPVEHSKDPDNTKPEGDQFFSTELPEEKKPEGYKPSKYPISSHDAESVFENIPDGTEYPNSATTQPNNENKHPEVFKPIEKLPGESGVPKKPFDSVYYPENHTEAGEKPFGTEYPQVIGVTKQPKDKVNGTEIFGVTRKPISSSGVPTDEFSTELSALKPGLAYLPQGELPNKKVSSSEHLNETSTSVVSEHSSSTETYFGFTDSAASSPAEENLLTTLPHFENHQDKPASVDLTQETGSSLSSQDLITKHPEQHTTSPSDLHRPEQFPAKPVDETKPAGFEINAPISVDYPERPKPVIPGEGFHKVQDANTDFAGSSSFPSGNHKDAEFSSEIPEIKRPEVPSSPEVLGTKKPDDEYQLSEIESTQYPNQYFSTVKPGVHKYPDSTDNLTSDVKPSEDISTVNQGDYITTPGKSPSDGNLETTKHPVNESSHLEETFNIEYIPYENYPEGISLPAEDSTRRPAQDTVSPIESTTDTSQGLYQPEKVSTGEFQKTTTPSENDLINKLHDIISGIQSQVTDGKVTTQLHGGYESTSPSGLPTNIPQDYTLVTDKFGRPSQKPQEFVKLPHDQTQESLTIPSRHPIDGTFSSENKIYDQITTDLEETENQSDRPQFAYTSESGSTDYSEVVASKGPEGIYPTEGSDNFSTKHPHQENEEFPHELKPVAAVGKPESTEFSEKPHDVKHPEAPIKDAITSHPEQSSFTSKHPAEELLMTGKPKPEGSTSTELPGSPSEFEVKYPEKTTVQSSHKSPASSLASFSQYPEDIFTTVSSVISVEHSEKPDTPEGNRVVAVTSTKTGSTTTVYPHTQDRTTQIYHEVKGSQTPIENVDNLIAEDNKTVPHNEDLLHQIVPQDIDQKQPISVPTEKPLHVVYPTYYPDGVVTRIPGNKPDGETDKKVTVTPQSTAHEDTTIKNAESSLISTSKFGETNPIFEEHTESSSESYTTSPVVIIQEVHTEVHSERATTKTDTEGYVQQTTTPIGSSKPELSKGKPHDHRPEHGLEKFTKQPELTSQTPQIVFGRPAIIQPTGNQSTPESQTPQPQAGHSENDKFPTLSTHAKYPAKQPESSTKPGFVTVTPIEIESVTKEFENIMHLYSPKDKYPTSASSVHYPESFTTGSPIYPERVKLTTEKGETASLTEMQTNFVTDQGVGTTHIPEILGTRFPSRKTTQKPTDGVPAFQEGTTITSTQGIGEEYGAPHIVYPGVTRQPPFDISTEGLPTQDKTSEVAGFATTKEGITQRPQGASFVPYKLINGNKVYYPEKESPERPVSEESSSFDGYDRIPYEIVNGTKFFYPNRVVTSQPEASQPTTTPTPMGMYVPYKIVNGSKIYYTEDKPQKPEKFDGLDYVPFEIINGTKIFYPEKVTTTPSPNLAMYVPFKIIDGTKVYYPKEAQEEPQNIPDEYDGFDYVPYKIVNGNKIFLPDHISGNVPTTTEHFPAMYVPYKLLNGNKVYYPKDAQAEPGSVPEGYDGFDLVPYAVVNGTKLFYPDPATTQTPEQVTTKTTAMFVPYKIINGTKVYFPKYAQNKPTHASEGYDGFDYLPYEDVNGTKVFRPERVTPKPEFTSTPAFYSSGMFVPYKIINNTKVFFPKDAQHKPRPLKSGYDGVQFLPYDVVNGTKIFYPERATTPTPTAPSSIYVPYKFINGTKVYYADKATENPEKIPEGYEGFDYVPYEVVNGNKLFYPDRLTPTTGMYVPYKKVNGSKVYYPKDSSEKRQPIPEGYDGVDYIPYEIINGTKVFYPDRVTTSQITPIMYVPYKMVNGTKVYYPKDAQHKPYQVPEGYDGFDSLPYEIVNGTNVFHPEDVTQRPTPTYPQGMFVPYKIINGTKVYYPQEAHKRPHPLSDEYAGLDYIPYEVINGTKIFHPERLTPSAVSAMYVPYKLINGTKVFYPKHAQHNPQQIPSEYDGFDYIPYEIINGSKVFYPNRVPSYQGMYVPYKIINGEKVFYPKFAQHKPPEVLDGYDGFDYLPYESINSSDIFKPIEASLPETPFEQAMYVPYKVVNGTKVFYAEYARYKPYLIPQGFDGFDYIPYEIVNGTKVFDPDQVATPGAPYKPAMYVPYKIIDGKKVHYSKHAQTKPHLVPEGYDGFDYIPYEVVNGTKIFDPEQAVAPGPDFKPGLYVPYKIMNGIKVYQPKYAHNKSSHLPQGYDGFDYLLYDIVNGNKVFYPEQSIPLKQAMYVPFKYVNGTKVFYPKYAQYVPTQTPEDYDGFEYIPYEIVKGDKVFHPEQAIETETPFRKAMYVPYKVANGTKIYYPKNSHYNPYLIPQGYDGFDYIPYEVVNGNKVFHPEQAVLPETSLKQAMYVPFKVVNGTKVYYPKHAQPKPQLISENYDGFDYLPFKTVNGTKVFESQVPSRPTYLQGMYVPYKSINNTKVFYPKDAHNKPNYTPEGYDGADYVPYELLNNTKMFYPELISTAQPSKHGLTGVYVPFKVVNNKKVFYPKEATPFPPTVRYPYDGVAFVPYKMLGGTSPSEIVYVDNNETFKPHQPPLQPGQVPGEGSCYINNKTFANNTEIPPVSPCQASCICVSSVVRCVRVKCSSSPENKLDCSPVYTEGSCCPTYVCGDSDYEYSTTTGYSETKVPEFAGNGTSGEGGDTTTPFVEYGAQKKPDELGDVTGGKKPEVQLPSEEYHLHKPPKPKPQHESLEPYDNVEGQLTPDEDYDVEDEEPYGPGTCRYAGKVYVSAQQIPRDDPCDFCFCFRSDIICLQQSCPPPIPGCRDEPIQGFCCPRYECHVKMANMVNVTSTTTTTTTTLPPHFFPHAFKGSATKTGCFVQGRAYRVGQAIPSASGPCMDCICGGNGRMKCEPKVCTPEPMIRKMISPSENITSPSNER